MRVPLQAWYDAWLTEHRGSNLIYANADKDGPSLEQVHRIRDSIAPMLWADTLYDDCPREPESRTDCRESAWVIAEHRSKSVRLPVFSIERPDKGIRLVLRNNYYDWKLSVISEVPIQSDLFPYMFRTTPPVEPEYTGDELSPVYFEGFPRELVFGYQSQDSRKWSASLGYSALSTTTLIITKTLGIAPVRSYYTREQHLKDLDAQRAAWDRRREREKPSTP